jgi:hypothetical protein
MNGMRSVDAGLLALRNEMTPGQRWTAVLAMSLTVLVLLFGLPRHVVVIPDAEGATASRASGGGTHVAGGAPAPLPLGAAPAVAGPASLDSSLASVLPSAPGASGVGIASPAAPPVFVALVRVGDRPEPGHDDASIAKTFLARAGLTATVLPLGGAAADVCRASTGAGNVVLAAAAVEPALRDCLVGAGATVLAFDDGGDRLPTGDGGQVLSTRRGVVDSLVDLGRWGGQSGDLRGKVGLVVDSTQRDAADAVVNAYRAAGIDVAATAVVSSDPSSSSVTDGVRAFASKGVQVAVLAAPVATQDRWVAAAAALAPGLRYVVSDAFDGVTAETYPPSFDGAVAHTSLRVPWFTRAHGQPAEQTSCLQAWQATATPSAVLSADEQVDVFAWCETVALATSAARAPARFGDAVRAVTAPSPLTSSLGPLAGGHWGPTQDAVLVWRASCVCWQEKQPFTDRSGP